jgi:hypothetical protein
VIWSAALKILQGGRLQASAHPDKETRNICSGESKYLEGFQSSLGKDQGSKGKDHKNKVARLSIFSKFFSQDPQSLFGLDGTVIRVLEERPRKSAT